MSVVKKVTPEQVKGYTLSQDIYSCVSTKISKRLQVEVTVNIMNPVATYVVKQRTEEVLRTNDLNKAIDKYNSI